MKKKEVYRPKYVIPKYTPNFVRPEILLHPNIPKPLHTVNPRSIMGKSWWDSQRKKAYRKNNFCCWACGVSKYDAEYHQWLEAHESYDFDYKEGTATLKEIVALCHACHCYIHSGRMLNMAQKGEFDEEKRQAIMARGAAILLSNGLNPDEYVKLNLDEIAPWEEWRLILEGKSYYSPFKNIDEWMKEFG